MEQYGLLLELEQIQLHIHIMELTGLVWEQLYLQVMDLIFLGMEQCGLLLEMVQ